MIIKVYGTAGEGKSAIASFIEQHLTIAGIEGVKVIDDGTEQYLSTPDMVKKIDGLKQNGVLITIETEQMSRYASKGSI